jgi:hypothetical protein
MFGMHSALPPQTFPEPTNPVNNPTQQKLDYILNPSTPLCREEVVWILEYIKKKVAEEDPNLLSLSQPRLLQNFRYFAEIALMLIQRRINFDQEPDRLKKWIAEASFGLIQQDRQK